MILEMKVLFVSSGMKGKINSIIQNQGESLKRAGVELDYYMVKGRGWKSYVKNIKPLRKKIIEGGYEVVHAHYAFTGYLVNLATMGLSIPVVVSLMGSDIWTHSWYPPVVRAAACFKPWKAVIVKSAEMRERVGIARAIVVPNGVDIERFCEKSKKECRELLQWNKEKSHVLFPADPSIERKNWPLATGAVEMLNQTRIYDIELHGMVGVPNDQTPIWYNAASFSHNGHGGLPRTNGRMRWLLCS